MINSVSSSLTEISLPQQVSQMDLARRRAYRERLDFYHGHQWIGPARPRERRLTLNYARALIDKLASYMMGELSFAVDPENDSQAARDRARRAEEALYRVYEDNQLALLDFDTEIDTSILGDGAFKVTWDASGGRVRVIAPDVQGLFVWTAGDDLTQVRQVVSQYRKEGMDLPSLPSALITEVWTEATFELWVDNERRVAGPNPYGFIPFVIFPNLRRPKEFWGESDLPAIQESQRELNRALSNLSLIMELSGNPIAVLENVEAAQDVEVKPGAVWEIPERARAYLLDLLAGGGVGLHIEYINLLYRTLHDLGEAPRTAFGDNNRNLSGVALEVELQPLLHKVKRKRLIRTAAYQRRNALILRLLEQFTGRTYAPYRSRVIWGPITPKDHSRLIADETALVSAGIHSRRRAGDNLGVEDPEQEFARWLEERRREKEVDELVR